MMFQCSNDLLLTLLLSHWYTGLTSVPFFHFGTKLSIVTGDHFNIVAAVKSKLKHDMQFSSYPIKNVSLSCFVATSAKVSL
jgi:hypothetical protein